MEEEIVYTCGHTKDQVDRLKLGCTEDGQCRPEDVRISREYFEERGVKVPEEQTKH